MLRLRGAMPKRGAATPKWRAATPAGPALLRAGGIAVVMLALYGAPVRSAHAGAQQYEVLADGVRLALSRAIGAPLDTEPLWDSPLQKIEWLTQMSDRLPRRAMPDFETRQNFLRTVRYEAQRAGLEPELVLGLIQVESGFMQVMPFWTRVLGNGDADALFQPHVNIRYGCSILRHYLDMENGNLFMALGRYNGSRGQSAYPDAVFAAWKRWRFQPGALPADGK